ncbi:hypothetical protein ACFSKM_19465 [Ancylobacter dichloromethanicus]
MSLPCSHRRRGRAKRAAGRRPPPRPPVSASPAPAAARAKGPPQDPVAFQRWLGIEQLKVDMRRLELEGKRAEAAPARTGHPALTVLYGVVLVALLALAAFLAAQMLSLRGDLAALREAQSRIVERLDAVETPAPAPQAAAPGNAQVLAQAQPPAAAAPASAAPAPAPPPTTRWFRWPAPRRPPNPNPPPRNPPRRRCPAPAIRCASSRRSTPWRRRRSTASPIR